MLDYKKYPTLGRPSKKDEVTVTGFKTGKPAFEDFVFDKSKAGVLQVLELSMLSTPLQAPLYLSLHNQIVSIPDNPFFSFSASPVPYKKNVAYLKLFGKDNKEFLYLDENLIVRTPSGLMFKKKAKDLRLYFFEKFTSTLPFSPFQFFKIDTRGDVVVRLPITRDFFDFFDFEDVGALDAYMCFFFSHMFSFEQSIMLYEGKRKEIRLSRVGFLCNLGEPAYTPQIMRGLQELFQTKSIFSSTIALLVGKDQEEVDFYYKELEMKTSFREESLPMFKDGYVTCGSYDIMCDICSYCVSCFPHYSQVLRNFSVSPVFGGDIISGYLGVYGVLSFYSLFEEDLIPMLYTFLSSCSHGCLVDINDRGSSKPVALDFLGNIIRGIFLTDLSFYSAFQVCPSVLRSLGFKPGGLGPDNILLSSHSASTITHFPVSTSAYILVNEHSKEVVQHSTQDAGNPSFLNYIEDSDSSGMETFGHDMFDDEDIGSAVMDDSDMQGEVVPFEQQFFDAQDSYIVGRPLVNDLFQFEANRNARPPDADIRRHRYDTQFRAMLHSFLNIRDVINHMLVCSDITPDVIDSLMSGCVVGLECIGLLKEQVQEQYPFLKLTKYGVRLKGRKRELFDSMLLLLKKGVLSLNKGEGTHYLLVFSGGNKSDSSSSYRFSVRGACYMGVDDACKEFVSVMKPCVMDYKRSQYFRADGIG